MVTTAAEPTRPPVAAPGLLGKLMGAVRPEFRVDILVPERGALVFDTVPCRVPDCVRQPRTRGLCKGHHYKWQQQGRPDIEAFAATASPEGLGRKQLTVCVVPGCRYGGARRGLCVRHHGFWERAGKPDRAAWLGGLAPVHDPGHSVCALSYCTLWTQGRSPWCVNHRSRWEAVGRPGIDEFTVLCESYGDDRFDFRAFGEHRQLKLELQYALQCRHDERQIKTPSGVARPVIALAAAQRGGLAAGLADAAVGRVLRRQPRRQTRPERAAGVPALRPPLPGGSALRQRMGGRVPPGCVGAAPAGDRGPQAAAVRRHPATLAAPAGETVRPLAVEHRPQPHPDLHRRPGGDPAGPFLQSPPVDVTEPGRP